MSQTKARPAVLTRSYQLLPVGDLSDGLDLRTAQTVLAPTRARALTNWSLSEPGDLVVRPGYLAFSSQLGASRLNGGQRVYLNTSVPAVASTIVTVIGWNGNVYTLSDAGAFSAAVVTGRSTNAYAFPADRDLVALFDGVNVPVKSTNGSSWTPMGITPGSVASTASSKAGGGLSSAEFEFSYSYKDRDLATESNASTGLSTLTLSSTGAAELQIPNSTDAQVDAVVVYGRNKTSGESVRRRASSGPIQGGVHSTITVTSSNWTTNDEEPTDHDVPSVLSFGVVWKNRWWARSAVKGNRLHFTQIFQNQSWPALFYIDIPFERGDAITALQPLGDALLVFGQTKAFVIIGQTSLDFQVRPTTDSQDGAFGFRAVCAIENGVVHAGASGVYIFDGTSDKLLSYDLEPAWQDLVAHAAPNDLNAIAVVYHQTRKEVRIAIPRRYPSATWGEFVLDLNRTRTAQHPAWTATDRTIGGYISWDGPETVAGNRGRLFSWHSSLAQVFEEATGTSANSSNLTASYEGPGLTLGSYRARWIDLRGEYEPNDGLLAVETLVDGVSQGARGISIGSGLTTWGSGVWGTFRWGGVGRRQFHTMLPLSADGRTAVQKVLYTGTKAFRWFGYALGIQPETRSRDLSE